MAVTTALAFNGNAEEALNFYHAALGGDTTVYRFAGTPAAEHVPADWQNKVLHATLTSPLGDVQLMDAPPGRQCEVGGSFSICIETPDEARAAEIFGALLAGGTVMMPFEQTFWAKKFGMLSDKFGIKWMVSVAMAPVPSR